MTRLILALCALALATAASASAAEETITGKPIALDGYTLRFVILDGYAIAETYARKEKSVAGR
ncbi:MAG: hypothetical protein IMF08_04610 [Proteobacteria bacterium]|nr:hypothetical protein [Pseudomonadota bacterium]